MKNKWRFIALLCLVCVLCLALCACKPSSSKTLDKPIVTVDANGLASWQPVTNATGYKYKINGGVERSTNDTSVQLKDGDNVRVKAVGNGVTLFDSKYSDPVSYSDPNLKGGCNHVDNNNDTICDLCNESVIAQLSFLSINDLHGKFMDTASQRGVDELTTYLKNLYADHTREEILLSTGDMWQGTAESSLTKGQLMTTWMNEVGFAAMALGNHEFDWGVAAIEAAAENANFPILGINVRVKGAQPDYVQSSVVVRKAGVKIGIIGAIGNCLSSISAEMRNDVSFQTGNALTSLVKNESNRLRNEEGCDFIVYILHDGRGQTYDNVQDFTARDFHDGSDGNPGSIYYDTSLSNGYVDLVFESHTHQKYVLRDEYGVYHLQGRSENQFLNNANVTYNMATNEIVAVEPGHIPDTVYAASNVPSDTVVKEIYDQYFPDTDLYAPIGFNSVQRNSNTIKQKVAQLYYEFGQDTWGGKYDIVLGGGYLNVRNPYYLYQGPVSYADVFTLLPFDNALVLGAIMGRTLKSQFINNNSYVCYYTVDPSTIRDSEVYYVIVDSYSSTYRYNNITEVDRVDGWFARDLIADFIKAGGWS